MHQILERKAEWWEDGPCSGLRLTDDGSGGVDDGAGHLRGGVSAGDEEQLEGEVHPEGGGLVLYLHKLVPAVTVHGDLLAFHDLHQLLHLAAEGVEGSRAPGLVPARGRRMSWAGVVANAEDQRQSSLFLPKDEDTDGHQRVGQQRPDGHEVHQSRQVEQEGHQSCKGGE